MSAHHRMFAAAGLALLTAFGSVPAWAHAKLLSSVPAANGILSAAPAEIILTFNEAVTLISFKIVDQDGKEHPAGGPARRDGATVHLPIAGPLMDGSYTVNYRAAGNDGHAMNATLAFSVRSAKPER